MNDEIEGDITTWHIRLVQRVMGTFETWMLFNGNRQESSEMPKSAVQRWRDEELAKSTRTL